MTRETDSSSTGPQGRGGAAYPSGTPPYGTRPFPSLHPQEPPQPADPAAGAAPEQAPGPAADEPRTETTMTTRIRINIPGSRPIPPVVVRTTVDEGAAAREAAAADPGPVRAEAAAEAEPEPEKTSDWFAPRKPVPSGPAGSDSGPAGPDGFGSGGAVAPAASGGPAPAAPDPFRPSGTGGSGAGSAVPATGSGSDVFGSPRGTDAFGSPRGSGSRPGAGPGQGVPPGAGSGADAFGAPGGPGRTGPGVPPGAGSGSDAFGLPPGAGSGSDAFGAPGGGPFREQNAADPFTDYDTGSTQAPAPAPPAGPGPGSSPGRFLPPPVGSPLGGTTPGPDLAGPLDNPTEAFESPFATGGRQTAPFGTEDFPPGVPRGSDPFAGEDPAARPYDAAGPFAAPAAPPADEPFPGYQPPAGPTSGPATGSMQVPPAGENVLRPSVRPRPGPPVPGPPDAGLSGDTLVSGIPAVPAGDTRRPGPPAPRPVTVPVAETAAPAAAAAKSAPPKKKGRSKLTLLGVAAGGIVVVAYGAGLLMDHADVPKGTTVLGVDLGDQNKEQAVQTLDKALGDRTTAALTLSIDGEKVSLKPSVAGLSIDTDATVRKVAHSDYNPVTVIGSLFGQSRTADPVIVVDEDKLTAALKEVAGTSSTASEGMIRFEPNKIVEVPGKAGSSLDVDAAVTKVSTAYRNRAQTGADTPITLPTTTVQPKVTQAELDSAANGFAKRAMSGVITVSAGSGHSIDFGPAVSLPKVLTMVADTDGKLEPHIDTAALKPLYGTTFDGVLIKRSDGSQTPVTPDDVAAAMLPALDSTTNRSVTLPDIVN